MRTLKQVAINMADAFTRFGLWKGGGSGGSSALSKMTDVTFTDLQANDILKYNGSVWINDDNLHEYSTDEKIVGKWIDGKAIYEKVIYENITDRDWHNIQMNVSIDNIIKLKGILYQGNGHPYFIELQGNTYPNTDNRAVLLYKKDENYIRYGVLYTQTDLSSTYLYIIIQYTKTN